MANALADIESAHVGQHHIEHDQCRGIMPNRGQGFVAVESAPVRKAADLGIGAQQLIDLRIVFDYQNVVVVAGHHISKTAKLGKVEKHCSPRPLPL
jgi:hypothetical protein